MPISTVAIAPTVSVRHLSGARQSGNSLFAKSRDAAAPVLAGFVACAFASCTETAEEAIHSSKGRLPVTTTRIGTRVAHATEHAGKGPCARLRSLPEGNDVWIKLPSGTSQKIHCLSYYWYQVEDRYPRELGVNRCRSGPASRP